MGRDLRIIAFATVVGVLLSLAVLIPGAHPTDAFTKDGHYYLKFLLAKQVGCFSWEEAHLIASADWAQDLNDTTTAHPRPAFGPLDPEWTRRIKWHAFGSNADYTANLAINDARWKSETNQTKKLVKFGQLLHFTEDRFAHTKADGSSYGLIFGHGFATFFGHDPDSLANDPAKTKAMVRDSLARLIDACSQMPPPADPTSDDPYNCKTVNRTPTKTVDQIMNDAAFSAMLNQIIANSDPGWYQVFSTAKMDAIFALNKATMDAYIKNNIGAAELKAECAPGNPVIPEPVDIKYDKDGEPTKVGDQEFTFVDPKTYQSDLRCVGVDVLPVSPTQVDLEIHLENTGSLPTLPGVMTVSSRDSVTETFVADNSDGLAPIDPGVPSTAIISLQISPSFPGHLITVDAEVDDAAASDNGWTFLFSSVGGIVELPYINQDSAAVGASGNSGLSAGGIAAIAGGMAAALLALGTGGWYVRRRLVRR